MKTNITIASNVYNRIDTEIQHDPNFVVNVIGRPALEKLKKQYGGSMSGVYLSSWQERMIREDRGCSYAKNGEKTHGLVRKNGVIVWEGRCEYSKCERFSTCTAKAQFNRFPPTLDDNSFSQDKSLTYEWLGNIEDIFQAKITDKEISEEETTPPEAVIPDIKTFVAKIEYEPINNSSSIINASIDSKILVNAEPGSGKTYTAIQRLKNIISNRMVNDLSNVLVLVYTNAAKNEILNRIESGIFDGSLPFYARNIDICTFDSLATDYLSRTETQLSNFDYNERIKLFNEKFIKDDFSNFEYVIIDELQDLVNERAKMTLNILSALQGGYLLLGDKCQAIYDYDCRDGNNVSSVEFYSQLNRPVLQLAEI